MGWVAAAGEGVTCVGGRDMSVSVMVGVLGGGRGICGRENIREGTLPQSEWHSYWGVPGAWRLRMTA